MRNLTSRQGLLLKRINLHIKPGAIIGDGDRKRAPILVLGLAQ